MVKADNQARQVILSRTANRPISRPGPIDAYHVVGTHDLLQLTCIGEMLTDKHLR